MDASRRRWFAGAGGLLAGGVAWAWARHARGVAVPVQACTRTGAAVPGIAAMPEESAGPFALHSLLDDPAIVRSQIGRGREGVPLDFELRLLAADEGGVPVTDAAVYVWHCDSQGAYSGYGRYVGDRFCRGLQFTDCDGRVRFSSIFPGWYGGRAVHVHFQVYRTGGGALAATSQFTFPDETTRAVQATGRYGAREPLPAARDFAFEDGGEHQLARVQGTPRDGLRATLDVGLRRA